MAPHDNSNSRDNMCTRANRNEWAGGTQAEMNGRCEYERFPSREQQLAFCRAYLAETHYAGYMGIEAAAEMLVEEAGAFVLANHWYWGLWAINQAVLEGVEGFDYITYAQSRVRRYYAEAAAAAAAAGSPA